MKIFVCRTAKSKKKMKDLTEKLQEHGHEVVDSFVEDTPPEKVKVSIWRAGKSLMLLSECDIVLLLDGWKDSDKCLIEVVTAKLQDIKTIDYSELDDFLSEREEAND